MNAGIGARQIHIGCVDHQGTGAVRKDDRNSGFFSKQLKGSEVKTEIVVRFFKAWAAIVSRSPLVDRLIYIDLFAGKGTYDEGESPGEPVHSTPLRILEAAIADPKIAPLLIALFNDGNPEYAEALRQSIASLPGIQSLRAPPLVTSGPVDRSLADLFGKTRLAPSFLFLDPFGYKGLTRDLIGSVLKDWGCDCVFFFNYVRLNMAFNEPKFKEHVDALFGVDRAEQMRKDMHGMEPSDREEFILRSLGDAMRDIRGKFMLVFRFCTANGTPKRHIVYISKAYRGYAVMKDAMASQSDLSAEDVPFLEYIVSEEDDAPSLFAMAPWHDWRLNVRFRLATLKGSLQREFANRPIPFKELFESHEARNTGLPFTKANYKRAVTALAAVGKATLLKPNGTVPRSGTCPDDAIVTLLL